MCQHSLAPWSALPVRLKRLSPLFRPNPMIHLTLPELPRYLPAFYLLFRETRLLRVQIPSNLLHQLSSCSTGMAGMKSELLDSEATHTKQFGHWIP